MQTLYVLPSSTDPSNPPASDALAPIVARLVQGSLAVADAVANLLVALEIIDSP